MEVSTAYRTHPVHIFPWLHVDTGHDALAYTLYMAAQTLPGSKLIVIDGFVGLPWNDFLHELHIAFGRFTQQTCWLSTDNCFRSTSEIHTLLETSLTSDPVFGRIFRGDLQDLWAPERVVALRERITQAGSEQLTIVSGFGASCVTSEGIQVYVDVPKDRGQQLAGQKRICNVGENEPGAFGAMYKRFYFVDWPMLNHVKRAQLPRLDIFVDGTSYDTPKFIRGDDFRRALHELAYQPFRVKPWFAPGPWGGQWMKDQFGLSAEQPNYAWSFELIAPENGILVGNAEESIECAFDYLLWAETDAILGKSVAACYGSYFPIRFDYLDTMDGTNLSCQVHPRIDYIRTEFGEPFTQDETYYIVTNKPGSEVFLGLRDDIDMVQFQQDATAASEQARPFDIHKHVHSQVSKPHDLFLIPSGTVHCSGANNLVLEISATPYIYTFKIYDYLRDDLAGNLRHVHLDRAFANIDATRTATWVKSHLCPAPVVLREEAGGKEYVLGNTEQLFFAIHRFEFSDAITDQTHGKFQVLNLVEGQCCEIVGENTEPFELRFAESVIIPASIGSYQLRNLGQSVCKVVKAFVKG